MIIANNPNDLTKWLLCSEI